MERDYSAITPLARAAAVTMALDMIEPGQTLGLGSGRSVWLLLDFIARKWPHGPPVRAAFASEVTRERAHRIGIESIDLDGKTRLDLAIDGADEVDDRLGLLKGGGAAMLREKLVACAAERFVVTAEENKRVKRLGETRPLPVEVVRFGWASTRERLLDLVPDARLRTKDGIPVVTDEGNYIVDCALPVDGDLRALGDAVKLTVGVIEHGLFLDMADLVLLGTAEGQVVTLEPQPT
jgi:ribose 5-phosphate isomerase A